MQTEIGNLTDRYQRIISALLKAVSAHSQVLALWLNPVLTKLILGYHCRALDLLGKLFAGLYRRRRPSGAPRKPSTRQAAPARIFPTAWKWLTRALPSPVHEAAQAAAAELQQLLSEPATRAIFEAAPGLRRHLRPVCRALGVTLPGEQPPRDPGPEPPPPPPEPRPLPQIGDVVHPRPGGPLPRRVNLGPSYRSQKKDISPAALSHAHFVTIS